MISELLSAMTSQNNDKHNYLPQNLSGIDVQKHAPHRINWRKSL